MKFIYLKIPIKKHIPQDSHPDWELTYIIKGHGDRTIGDKTESFHENDMVFIVPDMPHGWTFYDNPDNEVENITLIIDRDMVNSLSSLPGFGKISEYLLHQTESLQIKGDLNRQIASLLLSMVDMNETQMCITSLDILSKLFHASDDEKLLAGGFKRRMTPQSKVEKVKTYVGYQYKSHLAVEEVAAYIGMSKCGFSEFWKKNTGESFVTYLNRFRVETACHLMLNKDLTLKDICFETGFNDVPYFDRVFKKIVGLSPKKYRCRLGQ